MVNRWKCERHDVRMPVGAACTHCDQLDLFPVEVAMPRPVREWRQQCRAGAPKITQRDRQPVAPTNGDSMSDWYEKHGSAGEIISDAWPYDGPHDDATVSSASQALPELVGYLNNATQLHQGSLAYAATSYRVLASLSNMTAGLDQLVRQVALAVDDQIDSPTLYDDRDPARTAGEMGRLTAYKVKLDLDQVRRASAELYDVLRRVASEASHLGNEEV